MDFFELLEQTVDGEAELKPVARREKNLRSFVKGDEFTLRPPARAVDQVSAHRPSGEGEKVLAVLPIPALGSHQLQIDFVDQHAGLQQLIRSFAREVMAR